MNNLPLNLSINPMNRLLLEKLGALEIYDFSEIDAIIVRKMGWGNKKIELVKMETKCFLSLVLLDSKVPHIPNADVDEYWHRMILQTRWYEKFCKIIFGFFIHHGPLITPNIERAQIMELRTIKAMQYWYGIDWAVFRGSCCAPPIEPTPHPDDGLHILLTSLAPHESTLFV